MAIGLDYQHFDSGHSGRNRFNNRKDNLVINPTTENLLVFQGATFDQTFTLTVSGSPVNLTNYTAAMKVRATPADDAVLSLTNGSGITLGGAAGTVALLITATQTTNIPAGRYLYDLELTSSGVVTRFIQGYFLVSGQITSA